MARFNDPTNTPHSSSDDDGDSIDRIDSAMPGKTSFGPAIHRFRKLLAELIVRRFLNERRDSGQSDGAAE